tara:strand:+ start:30837 stop:31133 length:297 start_codon:yes stop_codon:yes gene_type:complete
MKLILSTPDGIRAAAHISADHQSGLISVKTGLVMAFAMADDIEANHDRKVVWFNHGMRRVPIGPLTDKSFKLMVTSLKEVALAMPQHKHRLQPEPEDA